MVFELHDIRVTMVFNTENESCITKIMSVSHIDELLFKNSGAVKFSTELEFVGIVGKTNTKHTNFHGKMRVLV